jgi:hypothetical protein
MTAPGIAIVGATVIGATGKAAAKIGGASMQAAIGGMAIAVGRATGKGWTGGAGRAGENVTAEVRTGAVGRAGVNVAPTRTPAALEGVGGVEVKSGRVPIVPLLDPWAMFSVVAAIGIDDIIGSHQESG